MLRFLIKLYCVLVLFSSLGISQQIRKVTIAYSPGGLNWPLYIAQDGGYYKKYGLNTTLLRTPNTTGLAALLNGDAQVLNYSLEQMMVAAAKEPSLAIIACPTNRGMFAMLARPTISTIKELKGRRIAVGQIGDASFGYSVAILSKAGVSRRDVEWIPFGPEPSSRAAGLVSGRVDAAVLLAPAYFRVEGEQFRVLVNFADQTDIFASAAVVMRKDTVASDHDLPLKLIKAQAEATKRFYEDREFALQAYSHYDNIGNQSEATRLYELYAQRNAFERIPYVLGEAIYSTIKQEPDAAIAEEFRSFDFHAVIRNEYVRRLVSEGFFRGVFGSGVKKEEIERTGAAFGGT